MRQHHVPGHRPPIMSSRHERWLYVVATALLLSGVGWLTSHFFLAGSSLVAAFKFDGVPHPSEPWWLRLHGAAMMGFLVVFGALLPGHVVHGLRRRKNKRSGIFMLTVVIALALTGYALYYLGDEATRPWISALHWLIGLGAAVGLVLHVVLGKRGALRIGSRGRGAHRRKDANKLAESNVWNRSDTSMPHPPISTARPIRANLQGYRCDRWNTSTAI